LEADAFAITFPRPHTHPMITDHSRGNGNRNQVGPEVGISGVTWVRPQETRGYQRCTVLVRLP
jgi:hypothetical protein